MSGLAGYDAWKTATPPEYEQDEPCCADAPHCDCGAEDEQDRRADAARDAAKDRQP